MTSRLALALVFVAACGKEAPAPKARAKEAPLAEPSPPAKPDVGSRGGGFELGSREVALRAKAQIAEHLSRGRTAVKAEDYETGIRELGAAKALAPMNARVLGELGWAYFLDGQLVEAQRELELALHHSAPAKTKGAVLYNLGRVHEARGDEALAAELYARSLNARPGNAAVRARLDDLADEERPAHARCGVEKQPSRPSESLCADLLSRWDFEGDDPSVCSVRRDPMVFGSHRAEIFAIHDYDLQEETFILAVVVGDTWYTSAWVSVGHPGVGYADENVDDATLASRSVLPGGSPELLLRWQVGAHDMDPGVLYQEDSVTKGLAVVSVDGGVPRWMAAVRTEAQWSRGDMDPDEWGAMIDPQTGRSSAEVSFDGKGSLTITAPGEPPSSTTVGTFVLGEYPVLCPMEQDDFGL